MTTLKDLPNDVLYGIIARTSFRTQAILACVDRDFAATVAARHATAAAARRNDCDCFCREGLPLIGELRRVGDAPFTAPALYAGVLATYDRISRPPCGAEGDLHRWYRLAFATTAAAAAARGACDSWSGWGMTTDYFGPLDAQRRAHGFGLLAPKQGSGDRYLGDFEHGMRVGFGLLELTGPRDMSYHGYFADDRPTGVGELAGSVPHDVSWPLVDRLRAQKEALDTLLWLILIGV